MKALRIEHSDYFLDSICSLSKKRAFSTACVKLANSFALIFDWIHSKSSGSRVIPVFTLCCDIFGLPTLVSIQPKLINIYYPITNQNKLKQLKTDNWSGQGWIGTNC
jgi:hypothetical protein